MRIPKSFLWKVIRKKCMDCCAEQHNEVDSCPAKDCPLWLVRYGSRSPKLSPGLKAVADALPRGPRMPIIPRLERNSRSPGEPVPEACPSTPPNPTAPPGDV